MGRSLRSRKAVFFKRGCVDMLPLSLAVLPWGFLFGSLAVQKGFSPWVVQSFSALVFGGSVQLVAVELLANGAEYATVLVAALVISSRHMLYGLSLRSAILAQRTASPILLSFWLTDELFAVSHRFRDLRSPLRVYYAIAAGGSFYFAWNLWTLIGIALGSALPDLTEVGADIAIAGIFIALLVPYIRTLASAFAATISAVLTLWGHSAGISWAMLPAVLLGMAAGLAWQRLSVRG